jgi:hypothetical protein
MKNNEKQQITTEQSNVLYTLLESVYYCNAMGNKQKAKDLFCEVCSTGCKFHEQITNAKRKLGMLDWQG